MPVIPVVHASGSNDALRERFMKRTIRTAIAVSAIVALSTLAVPVAAQASIYPPAGSCTVTPTTMTPGARLTFACADRTFSPNESVTITITGENGRDATIGMIRFAISTASGNATSTATGSLPGVPITLPSNASGTYNIAAVSPTSAGGTAAATTTSDSNGLPVTGLDSASLMGLWIGGGALLLAGVAIAVSVVLRRSRRDG